MGEFVLKYSLTKTANKFIRLKNTLIFYYLPIPILTINNEIRSEFFNKQKSLRKELPFEDIFFN